MSSIDYDKLAGKPGPAAKLLSCIDARQRLHRVEKDGVDWCPLRRHALVRDTGLSVDQYHRALRTLRKQRLVDFRMGYWKGVRMPHFALLPGFFVQSTAFQGGDPPQGTELSVQSTAFQGGDPATLGEGDLQSTALQGGDIATTSRASAGAHAYAGLVSKKESKKEQEAKKEKKVSKISVRSHATVGEVGGKQDPGKHEAGKQAMNPKNAGNSGKTGKTVADVLSDLSPKPQQVPKPQSLEAVWRQAYAEAFVCFVPTLTVKEKAQLKYFEKGCPDNAPARDVLRHAVAHWVLFVSAAQADAGAYSLPSKPNVGFLAKHLGPAVNLWLKAQEYAVWEAENAAKQAVAKAAQQAAQALQSTANSTKPHKPASDKATLAEVMAILGS